MIQVAQDGLCVSRGGESSHLTSGELLLSNGAAGGAFLGGGHSSRSDCSHGWKTAKAPQRLFHGALRGADDSCSLHIGPGFGMKGENGLGHGLGAEGPWTWQALPSLLSLPAHMSAPRPVLPSSTFPSAPSV